MSEPDELLAILCTTPCKDCRDKAAKIRAKWRLVPVDQHEHVWTEQPGSKDWDEHGTPTGSTSVRAARN